MVKMAPQNERERSVDLYLHALFLLTDQGKPADTGDVAARVGVSPAAASRMLRNLAGKKLVSLEAYKGAELTRGGMNRAVRVVRRHRLLEVFLHKVMGFNLRETHERALLMQATVDEAFEEKLDEFLDRPTVDPHGCPIPSKDVSWPRMVDSVLAKLPTGSSGRISRITSEDTEVLGYLRNQGLRVGVSIVLESVAPFDGPITLRLARKTIHLGRRLAQVIHIEHNSTRTMPKSGTKRAVTTRKSKAKN